MPFRNENFESMLSGSIVSFKKRDRPPLSDLELEQKLENESRLKEGIQVLRKLRTSALEEQDPAKRQNILKEAHQFSAQMAEVIIDQALKDKPAKITPPFLAELKRLRDDHVSQDAGSGHALPPQFSVGNLFRASDDMLVRIQEKAQSIIKPNHKLSREEIIYVLSEFLKGTNDLTINAIEKFFGQNTKVGGILSGGSVYLELAKKIVEKYGEPSLKINSFVIAVDKENKKVAMETDGDEKATEAVVLTDDMIDKGETILTALWATGEFFPKAAIYSGKGTDHSGGYEKRRTEKYMSHLTGLFQDFADLSDEGKIEEALAIFQEADAYAKENKVELQPGWHKRKARIEKQKPKQ